MSDSQERFDDDQIPRGCWRSGVRRTRGRSGAQYGGCGDCGRGGIDHSRSGLYDRCRICERKRDQVRRQATATVPPTLESWWVTADVYAVPPRLSSTLVYEPDIAGTHVHGWVVIGDSMYRSSYDTGTDFQLRGEPRLERVGGGWGTFVGFEDAQYWAPLTTLLPPQRVWPCATTEGCSAGPSTPRVSG